MSTLKTVILLILAATLLVACSGDKEKETETGKIDAMTKEMGDKAVRAIKTPIEKAQAAAALQEQHAREVDERGNQ